MYICVSVLAYFELAGSESGARWYGDFFPVASLPCGFPQQKYAMLCEFVWPCFVKHGMQAAIRRSHFGYKRTTRQVRFVGAAGAASRPV